MLPQWLRREDMHRDPPQEEAGAYFETKTKTAESPADKIYAPVLTEGQISLHQKAVHRRPFPKDKSQRIDQVIPSKPNRHSHASHSRLYYHPILSQQCGKNLNKDRSSRGSRPVPF